MTLNYKDCYTRALAKMHEAIEAKDGQLVTLEFEEYTALSYYIKGLQESIEDYKQNLNEQWEANV